MRNTLISEPVLLLHSDHMYWGHEKPLPALSDQDKVLLEEPSRNIQPCWGDDLSDTPLCSLGNPTTLAPTQGQTRCLILPVISCGMWAAHPEMNGSSEPRSLRSNGQNPEGIPWAVYNDQMPMFGQLSSPSGFLLSMSQIFLSSFLAKALLNG